MLTARLNRTPRTAAPRVAGRWIWIEIDADVEFKDSRSVETIGGWVNTSALRSRRFDAYLTDGLLAKLTGLASLERHVRKTRDASADYTSPLLSALCSVALLANA